MKNQKKDIIGTILICLLLVLLTIAGIISYKSIDWNVLNKMESTQLVLPTPIPENINTITSTPSSEIQ